MYIVGKSEPRRRHIFYHNDDNSSVSGGRFYNHTLDNYAKTEVKTGLSEPDRNWRRDTLLTFLLEINLSYMNSLVQDNVRAKVVK